MRERTGMWRVRNRRPMAVPYGVPCVRVRLKRRASAANAFGR